MAREVKIRSKPEDNRAPRRDSDGGEPAERPQADPGDEKLRPQRLTEIVGQRAVAERLSIALAAARKRKEPLPHILFDGPPGWARRPSRGCCTTSWGSSST